MGDRSTAVLIVGGGIIGLTLARELVQRGHEDICIIEKETMLGLHASGRNSGVLHAGIYYSPDSLKAQSCLNGNFLMRAYCKEKGLPVDETGKVIVARTDEELPTLMELSERAKANGAKVDIVDEHQLEEIEPNARTCQKALFSHYTAVVDPKSVLSSLKQDLESSSKVRFHLNCKFKSLKGDSTAITSCGRIDFKLLINASGAYCDRVARHFGVGSQYRLIPFKGIYKRLKKDKASMVRGSIYPVPDIRNPFLGIHFTRNAHGDVYLGPTAIPAFGRENYGLITGVEREGLNILLEDAVLFFANPRFRDVALREPRKYLFSFFFNDAARLVKRLDPGDIEPAEKVGIRAQLVDWGKKELVMDFIVERKDNSVHILNPISPAFTSSMDLAQKVVSQHIEV